MRTPDEQLERSDAELARDADMRPIEDVAADLGLSSDDVERYGTGTAKLTREAIDRVRTDHDADGNLILVTAMTATPKGAGKTVTTVGLGQALSASGKRAVTAIREPSLGPVFGIKGGAAGGGLAQVLPMEDINLHFTGDIHALTAAHDLLAAMLDAHLHHGNELDIDVDRVDWPRALDVNDRALRETVVGLGGSANGPPRSDGFQITAASELMAILGMASDLSDLTARIARIVVAYDEDGDAVTAGDLDAEGAMATLLKDALRPNLVQTIEGTPAFVHGGPFANIAHGTNTILADEMGRSLAEYTVTEAGFAADLGFEKFGDIVARQGLVPDAVVVVATIRALKYHGLDMWPVDYDRLADPDPEAALAGLPNLDHHLETVERFGLPAVVAVNRFPTDTDEEIRAVVEELESRGVRVAVSEVHAKGSDGGLALAEQVVDLAESDAGSFEPLYGLDSSLTEKIETVAADAYGAADVAYTHDAREDLDRLEDGGFGEYPVCISKTQHSITDDSARKGAPSDWTLSVRRVYPAAGAGFVVALTGDVLTMPGLPAEPAAEKIDVDEDGVVTGLF
ncbi:formate--tetrahydrofolate ligase [Halanaeroarchaeum sulfurireducens]|uniref:Formate--tetrahydrofolate ligase n=1 Tax=Halanaeroarchaeum sulfurireducens TaxID=1604004 RepID=A0A0F7PBG5_9EURY|nr:formate--tetrahydrofolate ligase [Halanaeroarchaeum sulfurireducens]AKH98511.1 formyltetrahydrofolate synthetase [Halanaeroarchaeum sulfurireducens]